VIIFLFASKEAWNASLMAYTRKRRANDGISSHEDDGGDDGNLEDCPDDDDNCWDDEENGEFHDPANKEPRFLTSERMAVLIARRNESFLSRMGHRFEDMVLSCTYRGVPCQ